MPIYKGKVHPKNRTRRPRSSLTLVLDGVGGQLHAPAALPPRKTRYPSYRRLGGPQSRSGQVRKISHPTGFDPRTFQPVASRCTRLSYPGHDPELGEPSVQPHFATHLNLGVPAGLFSPPSMCIYLCVLFVSNTCRFSPTACLPRLT